MGIIGDERRRHGGESPADDEGDDAMARTPAYRVHEVHMICGRPVGYMDTYDFDAMLAQHGGDILGSDWRVEDYPFDSSESAAAYLLAHGYEMHGLTFVRQLHPTPGYDVMIAVIEPCGWVYGD